MIKYILIFFLILILVVINFNESKKENFTDSLKNVDLMNKKMDDVIDYEKETRLFCKIIRNSDKINLSKKKLENTQKVFDKHLRKQKDKISDIKKKIIELKLNKNNKKFIDFNINRNKNTEENKKRKLIIRNAKNILKKEPQLNINMRYN